MTVATKGSLAVVTEIPENLLLTSITQKDLFRLIFSWLEPKDLVNFALGSHKCHEIFKWYNPKARFEKVCGFAKEMIVEPWNTHIRETYKRLWIISEQRPLSDEEKGELVRMTPNLGQPLRFRIFARPLEMLGPRPMELFRACSQTPNCPQSRRFSQFVSMIPVAKNRSTSLMPRIVGLFSSEKQMPIDEVRHCYKKLTELVFSLLSKMGPQENEPYVPPAERVKSIAKKLSNEKHVLNFVIEEAVWSILALLYDKEISDGEEDCKKIVQLELAKIDPEEVRQMERTFESTFDALKPLYETCKTIVMNQRRKGRQIQLVKQAEVEDLDLVRLLVGWFVVSCSAGCKVFSLEKLISALFVSLFLPAVIAALFPIRAEIGQDAQGAEVVQYIPHPLRSRARMCGDIILAISAALVALQFFGVLNFF